MRANLAFRPRRVLNADDPPRFNTWKLNSAWTAHTNLLPVLKYITKAMYKETVKYAFVHSIVTVHLITIMLP
jgi:hypothetical protein